MNLRRQCQEQIAELRKSFEEAHDRLLKLEKLLAQSDSDEASPARTILVADDDPIHRKVVCRMLQSIGEQCTAVGSGEEALAELQLTHYRAVLLDVNMPNMSGLETARRIRKEHSPGPYLIALTAGSAAEDRRGVMEAGMQDYLLKPLRLEDLRDALKQIP